MSEKPIKDQNIETTIEYIGHEGDGVGKWNGFNVIVPKTAPGDIVTCKVKYQTKNRIHADLINIIEEGKGRCPAPCQYFAKCGGCSLQHLNENEYKSYKISLLTGALKAVNLEIPEEIRWMSVGVSARRRAFIRFDKTLKSFGFYEHQSHNVIDISNCLVLDIEVEAMLLPLKSLSGKMLRHISSIEGYMITNADNGLDIVLHSTEREIKNEGLFLEEISQFSLKHKISRFALKLGKKYVPVITISNPNIIFGEVTAALPAEYFLQASKKGQEYILNAVLPLVKDGDTVLDLYSGIGTYSFSLASKAKKINAYEVSRDMISSMNENIRKNKLSGKILANCKDIDKYPIDKAELNKYNVVIINPPRSGAANQVRQIALSSVPVVIIVSCNSRSFAHDAKILCDAGYKLENLTAIDQFFYSHHLEQVGVFKRV